MLEIKGQGEKLDEVEKKRELQKSYIQDCMGKREIYHCDLSGYAFPIASGV